MKTKQKKNCGIPCGQEIVRASKQEEPVIRSKIFGVLLSDLFSGITSLLKADNSGQIIMASKDGTPALIQSLSNNVLMTRTAAWCGEFLAKRGYTAQSEGKATGDSSNAPLWVLELQDNCPVAKSYGIDVSFLNSARADAYVLNVFMKAQQPVVSIVGKNVQGVRSGLARLIGMAHEEKGKLWLAPTREQKSPFFQIRRLHVCPTGRIAQEGPWADTLWTNWSDERIRSYVEQLWLFGFNSLETGECRGYRGVFNDEQLQQKITPKLQVFMRAAKDNGLQTSLFIWGQSLFEEGKNYCWNSPGEREVMLKEYRRLAQTYGDLTDHLVVHVGDPGGCNRNGCDPYKTTQEITRAIWNEFCKVNPRCTATLSTWYNHGFWKGQPGVKFLDETYLPRQAGIALHRWYNPELVKLALDSGRPCDVWGWYLSDYEMRLNLHLFMRRLDRYFMPVADNIPADDPRRHWKDGYKTEDPSCGREMWALTDGASQQIRALSTEINFCGWPQIINAYVSGQKMWDPRRNLEEIEREFCAGTFGDKNVESMLKIYQACESAQFGKDFCANIPPSDALPVVFGTSDYNRQLREALTAADTVKLDSTPPRLTTPTSPKDYFDYLCRHLNVIAVFSEAREKIVKAKTAGADKTALQKILKDAQEKAAPYQNDLYYPLLVKDVENQCKPLCAAGGASGIIAGSKTE